MIDKDKETGQKEKNSTVAINPDIAKKLERFCKDKGITKKNFVSLSLSYFERFGIDPTKYESPSAEFDKLRKRLDQIVAFIRTQEKDKINPMFEAITTTEYRIKNDLDSIAKNETIKDLIDRLQEVYDKQTDTISNVLQQEKDRNKNTLNKFANSLYLIARILENNKNNTGLAEEIKSIFSK